MKKSIFPLPKIKGMTRALPLILFTLVSTAAFSQDKNPVKHAPSILSSPALYIMLVIIILLLFAILAMGESIKAAAQYRSEKGSKNSNPSQTQPSSVPGENETSNNFGSSIKTLLVLIVLGLASGTVSAQEQQQAVNNVTEAVAPVNDYWGLGASVFYAFSFIIVFELVVIFILRNLSLQLLDPLRDEAAKAVAPKPTLMERLNASVSVEEETSIMLDHNYDGIRELDNDLPPWWKYGFYVTILFSCVYLVHYHVTKTGKLQIAEYEEDVKKANEEIAEYRKKAADQVDENTVTLLTDAESINQGKTIFVNNCVACHGKLGEGGVGPNLTDDYWLHSGGIKDVFKSVKYGWPEKGMKSWQQDLTPKQIHQVSCYIKSIRGTNPPNAKEKQGEIFLEENTATADSTKTDSVVVAIKTK